MGAREIGVRVTALVPEIPGELAQITESIAEAGGNFISFTQFAGENASNKEITFKVAGLDEETVGKIVKPFVERVIDLRTCC
jgi:uncharacterized protein with ACT and thioredoxin-like domain